METDERKNHGKKIFFVLFLFVEFDMVVLNKDVKLKTS